VRVSAQRRAALSTVGWAGLSQLERVLGGGGRDERGWNGEGGGLGRGWMRYSQGALFGFRAEVWQVRQSEPLD